LFYQDYSLEREPVAVHCCFIRDPARQCAEVMIVYFHTEGVGARKVKNFTSLVHLEIESEMKGVQLGKDCHEGVHTFHCLSLSNAELFQ
jgi:hypothetical protein